MEKASVKCAILYFFKKAIILVALFLIFKYGLSFSSFFIFVNMEYYPGLYVVVETLVRPVMFVVVAIMACKTVNESEIYDEKEGINVYKKCVITALVCLILLVCAYIYYYEKELSGEETSFMQTVKFIFEGIKGFYLPMLLSTICVAIVGSVKITGVLRKSHENGIWRVKTADDEKIRFENNASEEDEWGGDWNDDYNDDYSDNPNEKF